MLRNLLLCLLGCSLAAPAAFSQPRLSLEQIMQGPDFVGHLPSAPRWSADSKLLYFDWRSAPDVADRVHVVAPRQGQPRQLSDAEVASAPPGSRVYNRQRSMSAYVIQGDLYLTNHLRSSTQRITQMEGAVRQPQFSSDGQWLSFEYNGQLHAWNLANGSWQQLSNFKTGSPLDKKRADTAASWLETDNLALFDVLRERQARADSLKARQARSFPPQPKVLYMGNKQLNWMAVSPDLRYLHYCLTEPVKPERSMVPDYLDASGQTRERIARPKVHELQQSHQYYVYDRQLDTLVELKWTGLPGLFDRPAYQRLYDSTLTDSLPRPRTLAVSQVVFNETGTAAVLQLRAHDNKDRWLVMVHPAGGSWELIDRQTDTAWIGGPGIHAGALGWIDEQQLWFQSEVTGYSHLYTYHRGTKQKRALSSGNFEILRTELSADRKHFYVHANKTGPFEQHFYKLRIADGQFTQLSTEKGKHEVVVSPDEKWLAVLHSASNRPTELYVRENKPGSNLQQLTRSITPAFAAYPWREPELVMVPASDGALVPGRLYRPEHLTANGAGVIFVHGAGYLQNVHHWWSQYYREYMFHHLLADLGYTVLDLDYRASAGYGRQWRTAIYRHMGGRDLDDQVDGARYLTDSLGVDAKRVGIYGGSYGGFITLMALTTRPGIFACGAALRAVTDWAHYNQGYTGNILNYPTTDPEAYRRSSPIYHASGLQGHLLMLHGVVDMNVHFQDIVRYNQRLIELGKTNWDQAMYPVEDHGFETSSAWLDEYRRILQLFEQILR